MCVCAAVCFFFLATPTCGAMHCLLCGSVCPRTHSLIQIVSFVHFVFINIDGFFSVKVELVQPFSLRSRDY